MASRAHVLGGLQRELLAARDVHADAYAAQLEREIARLSAGSPADPARETLAAPVREEVTVERPVRRRSGRPAG
jgi:hypothetical protein